MDKANKTPLLFVGHGNPMNVLEDNEYTLALSDSNEIPLFFNQGIDLSSVSMLSFIYK